MYEYCFRELFEVETLRPVEVGLSINHRMVRKP